ncbi:MAG: bifunctional phosphopantothenoylcysteine decarboxylase/phosphopantothenate--cysteine ligase CoaBC [Sphingobacteriia bacterium]|nr:bifunctional phosphopantothenoylcysteine decarboxylase/phosphopantothenate--cysteine ligase CoaBC [Sphingobacteriia bacterium]
MLSGKKILVGISASIAAYKSIYLIRLLVKEGASVKVVMTPAAKDFVSPLVLSTLSKNKIAVALSNEEYEWENHVQMGRWADIMIIAPLSCNTLAKMAGGICDNLLMASYLSATCPVVVAPAMDEDMWKHAATKKNIEQLIAYGNTIINVEKGELASGLFGEGRMAEPEDIVTYIKEHFFRTNELRHKKILITAGPTQEALDPVRYITNHSSGKMGYALAEVLYQRGAEVILISGPVNIQPAFKGIQQIKVLTADEMFNSVLEHFQLCDIAIMSAAVADYTPITVADHKIKKKEMEWLLPLAKTKDILQTIGTLKTKQYVVGFALETDHEKEYAMQKLVAKNADCIVLNSLQDDQSGFGFDTNKITIIDKSGITKQFELKSKQAVAKDIADFIISKIHA